MSTAIAESEIDVALDLVGISSTRLEIIRLLGERVEISDAALMAELGLARNSVRKHLRHLQACGIALPRHTTHPRGSGPITFWRVDSDVLDRVVATLCEHLNVLAPVR